MFDQFYFFLAFLDGLEEENDDANAEAVVRGSAPPSTSKAQTTQLVLVLIRLLLHEDSPLNLLQIIMTSVFWSCVLFYLRSRLRQVKLPGTFMQFQQLVTWGQYCWKQALIRTEKILKKKKQANILTVSISAGNSSLLTAFECSMSFGL